MNGKIIKANKINNTSINFYMIGCWGENRCDSKSGLFKVAKQMIIKHNKENKAKFVISMGDNLYIKYNDEKKPQNGTFRGGNNEDLNNIWKETWKKCFSKLKLPWLASLGNHSYKDSLTPDFFLNFKDKNWILPSHYWCYQLPLKNTSCAFIFLDTSVLVEYNSVPSKKIDKKIKDYIYKVQGWNKDPYNKNSIKNKKCNLKYNFPTIKKSKIKNMSQLGYCTIDKRFPAILPKGCKMNPMIISEEGNKYYKSKSNEPYTIPTNQFRWLKKTLDNIKNIDNIIIIGHHPIICHGHKEKEPIIFNNILYNDLYKKIIIPFNNKYNNIKAYICADEHNFQHLVDIKSNFNFIVAGTGGAHSDPIIITNTLKDNYNIKTLKTIDHVLGFLDIKIDKDNIKGQFINNKQKGKNRYKFII